MVRVLALTALGLLFLNAGSSAAPPVEGAEAPAGTAPAAGGAAAANPAAAPPAAAAAPGGGEAAAGAAAPPSALTLVGKGKGAKAEDFRFRLGQSATVRATGTYAAAIRAELAKSESTRVLVLHVDGVPMANLPVDASTPAGAAMGEVDLQVQLSRDPNDEDNLEAWTSLLKKQDGYTLRPELALAIGDAPAAGVDSPFPFEFEVAPPKAIGATLAVGLSLFACLYSLLVRSRSLLRNAEGGPYSLGKSQMAFWGLLVLLAFVGVWLLTDTMERIPSQVLILLGISGATGLGAVLIGANKPGEAAANSVRKSSPRDFFRDICSDGDGPSLHRLQVVAWTIVLGAVFVRAVSQAITMPEFAETLLVLMGISNGTYLGFKFPEKP